MKMSKQILRSLFLSAVIATLFGTAVSNCALAETVWFIKNGSTSTGNSIQYYGYSSPIASPPAVIQDGTATPNAKANDRLYLTGDNFSATFDGATADVNCFGIGMAVNETGTLTLQNGSTITATGGANNMFWVGNKGTGTLNILSGSKVTIGNGLSVGLSGSTGTGAVLVSGAGSTLTLPSAAGNGLSLGGLVETSSGIKGTLTVENGGVVDVKSLIYVGKNAGAGELNVNRGGTVTGTLTHTVNGWTWLNGGVLNLKLQNGGGTSHVNFGSGNGGGTLNLQSGTVKLSAGNNKYWGTDPNGEIHLSIAAGTTFEIDGGQHTGTQPIIHLDRLNSRFYDNNTVTFDAPKLYMNSTTAGAYTSELDSYAWPVGIVNAGTADNPVTFNANGGGYRFQTLNVGADGKSGYLVLAGEKGFWLGTTPSAGTDDPQMRGGMVIGEVDNASGSGTVVLSAGTTLKRTDGREYTSDRKIYIGTGLGQGRMIYDGGLTDTTWNKVYLGANGTIEVASGDYSVAARNLQQNDGHFEVSGGKLEVGGQTIKVASIAQAGTVYQSGTTASQLLLDNTTTPYSGTVGTMSNVQYIEVHAIAGTQTNPVVIGEAGKTTNYGVRVLGVGGLADQNGYLKLDGGAGTKVYVQGAQGTNGGLNIGNKVNTSGTLVVGENVKLTLNGDTTPRVGSTGTGTVTVESGAAVSNTQAVLVATSGTGTGTINLHGSWTSGNTIFLGGYNSAGGTGTINVYDGGQLTVSLNGVNFWGSNSSINIYEGGKVNATLNFGSATNAALNIQGGTFTGIINGQNDYFTDKTRAINIKDGGTFNLTAGGARINSVTGTGDFVINNTSGLLNISGNDAIVGNAFNGGNIYNPTAAGSNSVLYFNSTTNAYKGVISGRQGNGGSSSFGAIDGVVNLGSESAPVTFSATTKTNFSQYGISNDTGMAFRNFIVGGDLANKNAANNASGKYNNAGVNANAYALLDGGVYSVGINSNGLIIGQGATDRGVLKLQNGAKFATNDATLRVGVLGTGELIISGGSELGTDKQVALVGYVNGTGVGTISVDGAGSKFYVNELHLGGYKPESFSRGKSGTLNVTNGGAVTINGVVNVGMDSAKGTINIDGGTLKANRLDLAADVGQINFLSVTPGTTPITVTGATTLNGSATVNVSGIDFAASGPITLIDSGTMSKSASFTVQGVQNNAGGDHVDWAVTNNDLIVGEVLDLYTDANTFITRNSGWDKNWPEAGNWKDPSGAVKTSVPNAQSLVIVGTTNGLADGTASGIVMLNNSASSVIYAGYNINAAKTGLELSKGAIYTAVDSTMTGRFFLGNGSLTALGSSSINGTIAIEGSASLGANGDVRIMTINADIRSFSDTALGSFTISSAANPDQGSRDLGGGIVLTGNNANFHGEWILGSATRKANLTANSVDALGTGSAITMTNINATADGAAGTNRGSTLNVNATQNNIASLKLGTLSKVNIADGVEFSVADIQKYSADSENYQINLNGDDAKLYIQKVGSVDAENMKVNLNIQNGTVAALDPNQKVEINGNLTLGENASLELGFDPLAPLSLEVDGTYNILGDVFLTLENADELAANTIYTVISGSVGSKIENLQFTNAGLLWGMSASGNVIVGDSSAVPEPSSWALLILSCAGLYCWRRKKQ